MYQQKLTWEDEAVEQGKTFGRSFSARMKSKNTTVEDDGIIEFNMSVHRNVTAKRSSYLFVSSTLDDFSKIYNGVELLPDTFEVLKSYSESAVVTRTPPQDQQMIRRSTDTDFVELNSLMLREENTIFDTIGDHIPFLSNSIPTMFRSQDGNRGPLDFNNPNLRVDDIFLRSFSSPRLIHLSPPLSAFGSNQLLKIAPLTLNNEMSLAETGTHMNSLEQKLLKYFIESICPYCVCYPKISGDKAPIYGSNTKVTPESNPYLYLIVPLAQKSPLVMKALIASSAKQLVLLGQKDYEETAKKYSFEVLKELPLVINQKQDDNENNWDDVLATMIMLCFTEISASCNSSWLIHLNGAKQFLRDSCIQDNLSPIAKFFVRYFISHEVMVETAWVYDSDKRSMRPVNGDPYIETLKNDTDTKIDLVLGCSPFLISLIHKISVLGKCFEEIELESSSQRHDLELEILYQADVLKQSLADLNQQLPVMEMNDESDRETAKFTEIIAEIKRLAASIYLYARIELEYQFYHDKLASSVIAAKRKAKADIAQIIKLHNTLPDCYVSLLWPVFIVGIVATTEEERWFVLDSMTRMEKHRELRSVKSAKEVVLSIWKEKDLGGSPIRWKDMIKGKANTISLA